MPTCIISSISLSCFDRMDETKKVWRALRTGLKITALGLEVLHTSLHVYTCLSRVCSVAAALLYARDLF